VYFYVKCGVIINKLFTAFVISPVEFNNASSSSNLVTGAAEGYTILQIALMTNSVMTVMVCEKMLGYFVWECILI
jgi:hypothetical protein